jgi:predicted deacylase
LQALWQLPPTDGVLSYEAWKRGKIAIGMEYHGAGQLSADGVRDYRYGLLACLSHWGLLPAGSTPLKTPSVFAGDWILASTAGVFTAHCRLGDAISKGGKLASIIGTRGEVLDEFLNPCDGVILGLRSKAHIQPGNWAVLVGKRMETHV